MARYILGEAYLPKHEWDSVEDVQRHEEAMAQWKALTADEKTALKKKRAEEMSHKLWREVEKPKPSAVVMALCFGEYDVGKMAEALKKKRSPEAVKLM